MPITSLPKIYSAFTKQYANQLGTGDKGQSNSSRRYTEHAEQLECKRFCAIKAHTGNVEGLTPLVQLELRGRGVNRKNDSKETECGLTRAGNHALGRSTRLGSFLVEEMVHSQSYETLPLISRVWLSQRCIQECAKNKPQRNGKVIRDLLYQVKMIWFKFQYDQIYTLRTTNPLGPQTTNDLGKDKIKMMTAFQHFLGS